MTVEQSAVYNRVVDILVDRLKADQSKITPHTRLKEDLGADSLDETELMMQIEDEFNLDETEPSDAENLRTVGAIVEFIEKGSNH